MSLEVSKAGPLATVQDRGRTGWQRYGISPAGAMDGWALQAANHLLGNAPDAAAIEVALGGLVLRATSEHRVAVCGAEAAVRVNGNPVARWRSLPLGPGDELAVDPAARGVWSYVAVAGGVDVPVVLGSRATHLMARLGGVEGRRLRRGDVLGVGPATASPPDLEVAAADVPTYGTHAAVRVVWGPDDARFTAAARAALCAGPYTVTPAADRTGYRLAGVPLAHQNGADILSDAVAAGTIQVPADAQPIVLMADRQTTGGYTRIATVITADLHRVAQVRVGGTVSFAPVSVEEAQAAARDQSARLAALYR